MAGRLPVLLNTIAGLAYLSLGTFLSLKLLPLALDGDRTHLLLTSTLNPTLKAAVLVVACVLGAACLVLGVVVLRARRSAQAASFNIAAGMSAVLALLVIEGAARYSLARDIAPLNAPTLYANVFCGERYWKILLRVRGTPPMRDEVYHPTLGWTAPRTEANPEGFAHGGPIGEGLPIPFYGDSFMEGQTSAEETVPGLVAAAMGDIRADNLGVGGYSVGQIMLRYRLTAERYRDRPVVIGVMTEDLDRTPLRLFSSTLKPAYVLDEEGVPELIQVPVPRDANAWLESHPVDVRSYALASLGRAVEVVSEAFDGSNSRCHREEKEAVNLFAMELGRAQVEPMAQSWVGVIFASPGTFTRRSPWRREFLRSYFEANGIPYVDALDAIASHAESSGSPIGDYFLADGHPNALGNEVIADRLAVLLRPLVDQARSHDRLGNDG